MHCWDDIRERILMLCRKSEDGLLIFPSSGFIKYRSVLWALVVNPRPLASDRIKSWTSRCVGDSLGGAFVTAQTVADETHPPE